jgi:hypothetical protein
MVISTNGAELVWICLEDSLEHLIDEFFGYIEDFLHGVSLSLEFQAVYNKFVIIPMRGFEHKY